MPDSARSRGGDVASVKPLGAPAQLAYGVSDVTAAARRWSDQLRAGPFFWRRHALPASVTSRGVSAEFDHSSAYGQWGEVMVELVEVHHASPPALATVVGKQGLHHIARFVDSLDDEQRRLEALGWPELMTAATSSGLRYAFHDARAEIGHLVEIYEPEQRLVELYDRCRAAALDWDGSDPIRPL
jgi:catechol 2,3-dioxygenase-like lactoylglutathione lyase family enzyme